MRLLCRDFEFGQNLPDVTEEGGRPAEVEVVAGQRLRNNFDQTIFGHAVVVNLFEEIWIIRLPIEFQVCLVDKERLSNEMN